jgi:hypothetical protein
MQVFMCGIARACVCCPDGDSHRCQTGGDCVAAFANPGGFASRIAETSHHLANPQLMNE